MKDSVCCECGHTAHWHADDGAGDCEHDGDCCCKAFAPIFDDAWLAGFADGEGCFCAYRSRHGKREYIQPRFEIRLRADDVAVLEQLHAVFGGTLAVFTPSGPTVPPNAKPQACWRVSDKISLGRIVAYFDRFPLRAKKARDYAIWSRIVRIYIARGGGTKTLEELDALRLALIEGRAYETLGVEPIEQPAKPPPQLRLVEESDAA